MPPAAQDVGIVLTVHGTDLDDPNGNASIGIMDGAIAVVVAIDNGGRIISIESCPGEEDLQRAGETILGAYDDRDSVAGGDMQVQIAIQRPPASDYHNSWPLAAGADLIVFAVDTAGQVFFVDQAVRLADLDVLGASVVEFYQQAAALRSL